MKIKNDRTFFEKIEVRGNFLLCRKVSNYKTLVGNAVCATKLKSCYLTKKIIKQSQR